MILLIDQIMAKTEKTQPPLRVGPMPLAAMKVLGPGTEIPGTDHQIISLPEEPLTLGILLVAMALAAAMAAMAAMAVMSLMGRLGLALMAARAEVPLV
jgi:hypothetical protein